MPTRDVEHSEGLEFLYGRLNYEQAGLPRDSQGLGLSRMRRLMRRLGDPQMGLKIVHVAGSKGKGSTSTMLAAGLTAAGYRTGLFCSPHLHTIHERYKIDGRMIEPGEFGALIDEIRPVVESMDRQRPGDPALTFFEVTTAMGLLHFARGMCNAVVLEVGMGGRLDSTNIVRPLVSVLTSISLEHTRQLGGTTELIAGEKAGIIKRGGSVVSGVTDIPARNRIRDVATLRQAHLREVFTDYSFEELAPPCSIVEPTASRMIVKTWARDWGLVRVPFLGPHQVENAALSLAVFDRLGEMGVDVGPADVQRGWAELAMPARVEVFFSGDRTIVIDGAHSPAAAEALAATLSRHFPKPKGARVLVFGTTREKDLIGQLRHLLPFFDEVIVTRYHSNPRARDIVETCQAIESLGFRVSSHCEKPHEALDQALALSGPNGQVVVTGSLFLAAETRERLLTWPSTRHLS